jgi:tRNA nucleotidyltransferase (CCA-adding enzyme)
LQQACKLSAATTVRFATLVHDLGKGQTPPDEWPRHIAHEQRSLPLVKKLCERIAAPKEYRELSLLVAELHTHCHRARELKPSTILKVLKQVDALRRPERWENFLLCCEADARGRTGFETREYPQAEYLRQALSVCQSIDVGAIAAQGFAGQDFGNELDKQRLNQLAQLKKAEGNENSTEKT